MLSVDDPAEWALTSDGHPPPWVELGVFDVDGRSRPAGTEGEIAQRSPGSMLGYWNDPKRTADAFDREGWCRSGDLGRIDERGCLRVTGRLKDIIIRGGLNISAREVEDNLLTHPNVKDVAVVAMPDPVLGERACAFVVPTGSAPTLNDLATYLRVERRVSPTKLPERLEIVEALPITATGKVQKFELRDRVQKLIEAEQSSLARPASPRP
jgi:cyclohexanecarboxylate-CoA ligase/acyl-CoA synthetase